MNKLTKDNYPKESLDHNIQSAKKRIKFIIEQYNKNINLDFINSRKGYFRALFAGLLGYPVRTPSGITELALDFGLDDANHDALNKFYIIIGGNRRVFRYLEKFIKVSLKDGEKKKMADLNCYYAFLNLATEIDKPELKKEYIKTLIGVIFGYKLLFLGDEIAGFVSFCGNPADYKLAPFVKVKKVTAPVAPVAVKPPLGPILYTLNELNVGDYAEVVDMGYSGINLGIGEKIVMTYGHPEETHISMVSLTNPNKTWSNISKSLALWMNYIRVKKIQNPFK